jgi:hypothetical protein
MGTLQLADAKFYLSEVLSNGCCCGREKEPCEVFCPGCESVLPPGQIDILRDAILSDEYKVNYEIAVAYLVSDTDQIAA